MTHSAQPGILAGVPVMARYLTFRIRSGATKEAVAAAISALPMGPDAVVGLGSTTLALLGADVRGMRPFPHLVGQGVEMPGSTGALWCWLRGADRGELLHRGRSIERTITGGFVIDEVIDSFRYAGGLDLSGYEDGTENPVDDRAIEVALVANEGLGMDGSSFVAVQKWHHDLDAFQAMAPDDQDATIGRRRSDNEEIEDAPQSAHVKRTAQEDFDPEAFVVRRSMPWSCGSDEGLVFVAFGATFDPFEALAKRMLGLDDGVVDALFRFTRPETGSYYWCPPVVDDQLDLRRVLGGV